MNAKLETYRGRRILNIGYSTLTDGHTWDRMVEQAKQQLGIEGRCLVIFTQDRREVNDAGR